MNILDNLNDVQKEIVCDTEGKVLVLAGAGSGKTRVLTHRVAYLVQEKGVYGRNILAITFTNKATAEMRNRLNVLLGEEHGVWVSTFHSLAASILRRFGEEIGYDKNFSIYDESDSGRVINKALRELHLDGTPLKENGRSHISKAKNDGMDPDEYFAEINGTLEEAEDIRRLFERYEELLKQANAMDFDDLLHKLKFLLENSEEARNYYQNRFRYIHVDEFQDTNKVQYEIVKILQGKWGNLFVVGDDDQSIYGWRGAKVENILNFERDFPGETVKVHRLMQNYRSTEPILKTANNVIKNNKSRHEKELFTERKGGVRVEYYTAWNDHNEAEWVINQIGSLIRYNGYRKSDFAILVRANSLTRIFENKLNTASLGYRVIGGFKFFERKEIQDVVAYMRMVANTRDNEAVSRIINFPARGIGDATVEKLEQCARTNEVPVFDILLELDKHTGALGNGVVKKVEGFRSLVSDLVANSNLPLDEFVVYLVERVGFELAYASTGKEEDFTRWENINEFVNYVKEYHSKHPNAGLGEFLQTMTLVTESKDELTDPDKITLATMHAVKGLEFPVVFIVGCEEEIFPTARSINGGDIEEERRIMYVAITRAKERLYISCAQKRFRFNHVMESMPSRFIDEAKGKTKENAYSLYGERKAYLEGRGGRPSFWGGEESDVSRIRTGPATRPHKEIKPVAPAPQTKDISGFIGGAKVVHPTYGEGTILVVLGSGKDTTATVAFPKLGTKKFILALAPLKLVK